jgi:hypothetical protein
MKSRLISKGTVPGAPKEPLAVPKMKEKTDVPLARETWRDRLNKKMTAQTANHLGAHHSTKTATTHNPFQNTAPGNASRKTRKGFRPG